MSRGAFPPASGNRFLVLMRQAVAKYGKPSRWSPERKAEVQQWVTEQLKNEAARVGGRT